MAQQCFINEYVFALDDIEQTQSRLIHDRIADALKAGTEVAPLDLIVAASYRPLYELPLASLLLSQRWPDIIERLLTQQVREPLEEEIERKDVPALTPIDDAMLLRVQNQYEENPYPRWSLVHQSSQPVSKIFCAIGLVWRPYRGPPPPTASIY